MAKAKQAVAGICLVIGLAGLAEGRQKYWIESRLFQASREEVAAGPAVIVTAGPAVIANPAGPYQHLPRMTMDPEWSERLADTVSDEVTTIYKYPYVEELAKINLAWDGAVPALEQTVVLDAKACRIRLSPRLISKTEVSLRVEINQGNGGDPAGTAGRESEDGGMAKRRLEGGPELLDTEIVMKVDEPVVLGFPVDGRSYFLLVAIKTTKRAAWRWSEGVSQPYAEANLLPPPAPLHRPDPEYPASLKEKKIEGQVVLEVITDKMGKVTDVRVVGSAHPELDKSAREALKRWRFESALLDGRAVPVAFQVTVEFKSRGESMFH